MLTIQELRALFTYDPDTGILRWACDRWGGRRHLTPMVRAGTPIIDRAGDGYLRVRIAGKQFQQHRVAWALTHGEWPPMFIDHINGIKDDNRLLNLRSVTPSENLQNQRRAGRGNRSTRVLGVTALKNGKFQASICLNNHANYLGMHDTAEEAHQAYVKAKRVLHPAGML